MLPKSDFSDDPLLAILAVLEQSWLNLEILPHLGRHLHLPCKQAVPQETSRDFSHGFCRTNISLYTSSWSLWETHSFIMKTYEVEHYTLQIQWMGLSRTSQSLHHLICKSVVLGSRHLGHRCTLRAFFQDELLTSITQLG